MKHALLSNDDGYLATGILELNQICKKHFETVQVIAPDRNCSGASSALTLRHPLYSHQHSNGFVSIEGTPADCVIVALSGFFDQTFDIVLSGINLGANLGDDVVYSGTVAAAIEGRFLGYPSLAISLTNANPSHFATAEYVIDQIINKIKQKPLPSDMILNINIPDIPLAALQGIKTTRIGFRHQSAPIQKSIDKHGRKAFWIGDPGEIRDGEMDTDFWAIKNNYASITPIQIDLTEHQRIKMLDEWLEKD